MGFQVVKMWLHFDLCLIAFLQFLSPKTISKISFKRKLAYSNFLVCLPKLLNNARFDHPLF